MCIHLGRGKAAVTEQFFNSIQVRPIIHKVRGKTVSENMWTFFLQCRKSFKLFVDQEVGVFWVKFFSFLGQE